MICVWSNGGNYSRHEVWFIDCGAMSKEAVEAEITASEPGLVKFDSYDQADSKIWGFLEADEWRRELASMEKWRDMYGIGGLCWAQP